MVTASQANKNYSTLKGSKQYSGRFSFGQQPKIALAKTGVISEAASWGRDGLVTHPGSTGAIGDNSPIPQEAASILGSGRFEPEASWGPGVGVSHKRQPLPPGHRFFADGERETMARFIDWTMTRAGSSGQGSWFTTLTFKDHVTPYRANKMARRWLSRLSQGLEDNGGSQLKSILATEWQKRQVIHYHLLLTGHGLDSLSRKRWECRWKALGGGFARVYDADMKAAPYLAKYLNKRLGGEVDIGGAWQGMVVPKSVSRGALT